MEIVYEYERLVIIQEENVLSVALLVENEPQYVVVNPHWEDPTNEEIENTIISVCQEADLNIDDVLEDYKKSSLYFETEQYNNRG